MTLMALTTEQKAVEHEMPGLAGCYLRFCAERLGHLEEYIARHDIRSISRIAHALSGNAKRIGLSELSSLGRQLEEYCLGKDWEAIDSAYRAIAETVVTLCETRPRRVSVLFEADAAPEEVDVTLTN